VKVLEVMHKEDDIIYYDFFTKDEYELIINEFFIQGGYDLPEELNPTSLGDLTEKDFSLLFECIGYDVLGFSEFDPIRHISAKHTMPSESGEA